MSRTQQTRSLEANAARKMSCPAYTVYTFTAFADGFSAQVETEIEAYRLAHDWQHAERTKVEKAGGAPVWITSVYSEKWAKSWRSLEQLTKAAA